MTVNVGLPHPVQSTCLEKFRNCAFSARIRSKLGPKWPTIIPNEVFWTLIKIESLVVAGTFFR